MYKLLERTAEQFLASYATTNTVMASYRGPAMRGGVSSTLEEFVRQQRQLISSWLFVGEDGLQLQTGNETFTVQPLSKGILEGHYTFCNDFLWPLMHQVFTRAQYKNEHFQMYREFNALVADSLCQIRCPGFFVHDYQLALVPGLIKRQAPERKVNVFWHIPWPARVPKKYESSLAAIAKSLAQADCIGFHTEEYKDNFLNFASKIDERYEGNNTVVAPLGIDVEGWRNAACSSLRPSQEWFENRDYVLSVDRADYTKGILTRLNGIDKFLETHPEWLGKVVFVQHCARTRTGLESFDKYWFDCRTRVREINAKYHPHCPVHWLAVPLSREWLAALFRDATAMLITPWRDGLNLTAKEFVLCQRNDNPGVLVLSRNAGVFQELGACALPIDPCESTSIATQIATALTMPIEKRSKLLKLAKRIVTSNNLSTWVRKLYPEWTKDFQARNVRV